MLSRLPSWLHRAVLRIAQPIRIALWAVMRREVRGCNVLAFDPAGCILLVRHSYHQPDRWLLPGGGLARGEDPASAGTREFREETGCALESAAWVGTDLRIMPGGWTNRIEIVAGEATDTPCADGREIIEAAWFPPGALPAETGAVVHAALVIWRQARASER